MRKHLPGCGRELQKKGMSIDIKHIYHVDPSEKAEARNKAFDAAVKTLKRRMVQEGVIRDMRRKEYYETKGQIARKRKKEGERRVRKAAASNEW